MPDRQKDRTCSTAVHALRRSDEGEWLEIAESLWEAGERAERETTKDAIAAALSEGEKAGRRAGRREALEEAAEQCAVVALGYAEKNVPGIDNHTSLRLQVGAQAAGECGQRIRALAREGPHDESDRT